MDFVIFDIQQVQQLLHTPKTHTTHIGLTTQTRIEKMEKFQQPFVAAKNMLILCFASAPAAFCVNSAARHRPNIQHLPF